MVSHKKNVGASFIFCLWHWVRINTLTLSRSIHSRHRNFIIARLQAGRGKVAKDQVVVAKEALRKVVEGGGLQVVVPEAHRAPPGLG